MNVCPACNEPAAPGAAWCEACGADLDGAAESALAAPDAAPCVSCGEPGTSIAADGYCGNCGHKQPDKRDHLEIDETPLVLVTDRGKRHHRNEDMGAIGRVEQAAILVVCDGVSTTDNPELASLAAAEATRDSLVAAIAADLQVALVAEQREAALVEAINKAQAATVEIPKLPGGKGSPSSTIVASIVVPGTGTNLEISTAWLGDSRGYWLDDGGATQLTTDHSWAHEQVADGVLEAEEAQSDPRAHTITRWLGADAHELEPGVASAVVQPGMALLCSDGLWNYAADDAAMTIQARAHTPAAGDIMGLAQNLVAFALESGGHDNTTVAIADFRAGSLEPAPVTAGDSIDQNDTDGVTAPVTPPPEPVESTPPTEEPKEQLP